MSFPARKSSRHFPTVARAISGRDSHGTKPYRRPESLLSDFRELLEAMMDHLASASLPVIPVSADELEALVNSGLLGEGTLNQYLTLRPFRMNLRQILSSAHDLPEKQRRAIKARRNPAAGRTGS